MLTPGIQWPVVLIRLAMLVAAAVCMAVGKACVNLNEAKLRREGEDDPRLLHLLPLEENSRRYSDVMQLAAALLAVLSLMLGSSSVQILTERYQLPSVASVLLVWIVDTMIAVLTVIRIPGRIANRFPERILLRLRWLVKPMAFLMTLPSGLLNLFNRGIARLFGVPVKEDDEQVTEDDIRMLVDEGGESGAIDQDEQEMIQNVFKFNDYTAEELMVHRTQAICLSVTDSRKEILDVIRETGLSRFPVRGENIDDIVGILYSRDYLLEQSEEHPQSLRHLVRPAYFVPDTVTADVLFGEMQKRKTHMAVVTDEYGGMKGIITMEDLLEKIVGNILDEKDDADEADVVSLDENLWRIAGGADLEEVAETLDVELPLEEDFDTFGGLIFDQLTTIPPDGSKPEVQACGLRIRVESLRDHRVEYALVSKINTEE